MDKSLQSQSFHIKTLHLKNFKKFKCASIPLGKGLNFLIGPNNAGKSTILEAIDIVIGGTWLNEEMIDSSFFSEGEKEFIICAKVEFPKIGTTEKRINFIRNLKLSKGSGHSVINGNYTNLSEEKILDGDKVVGGYDSISESGLDIKDIHFFSSAKKEMDDSYEIENYVLLSLEKPVQKGGGSFSFVKISLGRQIRSNLISFLFVPAARSENRQLFQIAPYTWLGKYLKNLQIDQKEAVDTFFEQNKDNLFPIQPEKIANDILENLLGGGEKISFHSFDYKHADTLFKYAHVFLEDPFFAEIEQKGHGVQSATAIALFASLLEREAKSRPKYSTPRSGSTQSHWATILEIEEPESHFHPPARARLISLLKQRFVNEGAQVIISTHDEGFVKWPYMNGSNLIFPETVDASGIVRSVEFSEDNEDLIDENSINSRILRFQSQTIFSEKVLIVEGCEAVCLDAMLMRMFNENFSSNSIAIAQSVSPKPRNDHGDGGNLQSAGGASQIPDTVKLYKQLNIKSVCLIDIDCLFNGSIGGIISAFGGNISDFNFPSLLSESEIKIDGKLISAQEMREKIRVDKPKETLFKEYVQKLVALGIFIYDKGDFEGNFKSDFVDGFIHKSGSIIKEALVYGVKHNAETNDAFEVDCLSDESNTDMRMIIDKCKEFFVC